MELIQASLNFFFKEESKPENEIDTIVNVVDFNN